MKDEKYKIFDDIINYSRTDSYGNIYSLDEMFDTFINNQGTAPEFVKRNKAFKLQPVSKMSSARSDYNAG